MATNLSLIQSPTFGTSGAKFGNGMTGGVGTATPNPLPTTGGFTVEAWFNFAGGGSTYLILGSKDTFWVGSSNGNLAAHFGFGTTEGVLTGPAMSAGTHHVALVCGTAATTLYLDGVSVATSTLTFASQGSTFASGVGVRAFNDFFFSNYAWPGTVDEVAFWSGSQYTGTFTPPTSAYAGSEAGLVALYHLEADGTDSKGAVAPAALGAPSISGLVPGGTTTVRGTYTTTAPTGLTYSLDGAAAAAVASPTIGSGTYSFTLTTPVAGSHSITVTGTGANTTTSPSTAFTTTAAAVAALGAPSVSGLIAGGSTTASGSYANGTPTGLKYSLDGAAAAAAASPTISGGTYSFTFATPAAGSHSITVTGTGANTATSPSTAFTTSVATTAIAPNNAALVYSPYNWQVLAGVATAWNPGAYFKVLFTGSTCVLNFDISVAVAPFSQLWVRVDNGPWTIAPVAATVTCAIPSITAGNADVPYHRLDVVVKGMCNEQAINRWVAPVPGAIRFMGLTLAAGASVLAPVKAPLNLLIYGDSITEGNRTLGEALTTPDVNDAMCGWAFALSSLMGAEVGIVGFGGTGYLVSGYGSVPAFPNTYNLIAPGISRTFLPAPDLVIVNHGTNDNTNNVQAAAIASLNGLMASVACKVVLLNPLPVGDNAYLQAAVAGCSTPSRAVFVSTAGFFNKTLGADGYQLHPSGPNNTALIAPRIAAALRPLLAGAAAVVARWTH